MLLTPEKKRKYSLGWRKREDARKQLLGKRKTEELKNLDMHYLAEDLPELVDWLKGEVDSFLKNIEDILKI